MTAVPANKSFIDFEDDFVRENYIKFLNSFSHRNISEYLHLDILVSQKIMLKIQQFNKNGSLKDFIYKSVFFVNLEPS
jgi:hypothetical protein